MTTLPTVTLADAAIVGAFAYMWILSVYVVVAVVGSVVAAAVIGLSHVARALFGEEVRS